MSDKEFIENTSGNQVASLIPANWEEIANLRLALLEQEYQECLNATITNPNPDHFEGLDKVILEDHIHSSDDEDSKSEGDDNEDDE